MSYPPPIEGETAERLYRQAIFFYKEYELTKKELNEIRSLLRMMVLGQVMGITKFPGIRKS